MSERYETTHLCAAMLLRGSFMRLQKMLRGSLLLLVISVVFATRMVRGEVESDVDYLTDIKPLLREKCFACHSSLKQESGLRLDAASLIQKGGESGPGYVAGSAGKSLILERVTEDDDNRMPPAEAGARLTAEEVAKLSVWVEAGAVAPEEAIPDHPSRHWSFLPPVKADEPSISAEWIRGDIDRFVA